MEGTFSKIFSKYFINVKEISSNYTKLMEEELSAIQPFLRQKQKFWVLDQTWFWNSNHEKISDTEITFIEKNYTSKKIKYGWDGENKEGYNDLSLLENLIITNDIPKKQFCIFNFDKGNFPTKSYDLVISLYSLDYHYDLNIYLEYLKKNTDENSIVIFDTIRYEYFYKIFNHVEIIKEDTNTVHKSKRIACRIFK